MSTPPSPTRRSRPVVNTTVSPRQPAASAPSLLSATASHIVRASPVRLALYALGVRLAFVCYSMLHDAIFQVKFTDIDYYVVSDAAGHMLEGRSPFARATYRYTPALALLLIPNHLLTLQFGKILFSAVDVMCGMLCWSMLNYRHEAALDDDDDEDALDRRSRATIAVAVCVLFNPLLINISTRGNCDMMIAGLCLLMLHAFQRRRYALAAVWCGLAVHFKVYPITYAFALVLGLVTGERHREGATFASVSTKVVLSAVACIVGAGVPTYLCYVRWGDEYLREAITYHFGRLDHRHNLSPYFLPIYLALAAKAGAYQNITGAVSGGAAMMRGSPRAVPPPDAIDPNYDYTTIGTWAFFPQVAAMLCVAWVLRRNVAQAIAVQTIVFVAFNKVATVQYFAWYLPFLPFVIFDILPIGVATPSSSAADSSSADTADANINGASGTRVGHAVDKKRAGATLSTAASAAVVAAAKSARRDNDVLNGPAGDVARTSGIIIAILWVAALVIWLLVAKALEFDGDDVYLQLWIASIVLFVAHVVLAVWALRVSMVCQWRQEEYNTFRLVAAAAQRGEVLHNRRAM